MSYFNYNGKRCFYREEGTGEPVLFLHGNTAFSKMFDFVQELYQDCRMILLDCAGHGQSDRLEVFEEDFWFDQGMQAALLLTHLKLGPVSVIGTSGGALAAINLALERPELVRGVVADSFEGENSLDDIAELIQEDRRQAKQDENGRGFYLYNQGADWERVVDQDTDMILRHAANNGRFFHKPLEQMDRPVLMTGSREDAFVSEEIYQRLQAKMKNSRIHMFDQGEHPAMFSNAEEFAKIAKEFLVCIG